MADMMQNATEQARSRMGWVIVSVFVLGLMFGGGLAITFHSTECVLPPGTVLAKAPVASHGAAMAPAGKP